MTDRSRSRAQNCPLGIGASEGAKTRDTAGAVGTLAPSLTLQVNVPTNQWARVSASSSAEATCLGPFRCDLDVAAPAQISVTEPNRTLVAWHGIAGLTAVPEPSNGIFAAFGALAVRERIRARLAR